MPLRDVPITRNGSIGFQVENAMAGVAAAWGVGLPWDVIRRGLASFQQRQRQRARAASMSWTTRAPP
jgi:UDP-N-acetylmuramyl pentapeptide synthase